MTTIKESWKKVGKDLGNIGDNLTDSELGENVKQFGKDFGQVRHPRRHRMGRQRR